MREIVRLYVRAQRKQAKCGDGASTVQCHVLTELLREEGLAQRALAERLGLDKGWISRAVDTLVMAGDISKHTSEQDRRSVTLSLTPAGRIRARELAHDLDDHAARLLQHVPHDRHVQVQDSLQLLFDALSGSAPRLAIRPAANKDWPAIRRMLLTGGLPPDGAQDHLAHFMVGEAGGKLVCAGGLEVYGADALLRSVVVNEESRGNGWGKQLLDRLTEQAVDLGVGSLYLLTTTADAYFSRLGYSEVSRTQVPDQLRVSRELQGVCPASATAMMKHIGRSPSVQPGVIRPATSADASTLAAIYNHYVANTTITFEEVAVDLHEMEARIESVSAKLPWLVFERDGQVIGYAYATPWRARSAYRFSVESTVYVAPGYARQGIGSQLYTALIYALRGKEIEVVLGGISQPNPASVALHENLGFEKVAHFKRVGRKFDQWIDVGYWELQLR